MKNMENGDKVGLTFDPEDFDENATRMHIKEDIRKLDEERIISLNKENRYSLEAIFPIIISENDSYTFWHMIRNEAIHEVDDEEINLSYWEGEYCYEDMHPYCYKSMIKIYMETTNYELFSSDQQEAFRKYRFSFLDRFWFMTTFLDDFMQTFFPRMQFHERKN
jgi:hypothetical protein